MVIISALTQLLPLFIDATKKQLAKLQTLQLKSARLVLGNPCFRWSTACMLQACSWHSIYNLITEQSMTLIHKIVTDKQPQALADLMTSSMHNTVGHRYAHRVHMKHHALTDRLNNSLMYKALSLYLPHTSSKYL